MDSGIESSASEPVDPVDVALLMMLYVAAFEHCLAQAAKLPEQNDCGRAPIVQQIEAEREALEGFAAARSALLIGLAMIQPQIGPSLAAETRDEVIRRSIAKRSEGSLETIRRPRFSLPRRIA